MPCDGVQLELDPHCTEIVDDGLAHGEIRGHLVQFPGVKAVGIAGLSKARCGEGSGA